MLIYPLTLRKECQKAKLSPLIVTKDKKISVFMNHLDASNLRREQLAHFFSERGNHKDYPVNKVYIY